MLLGPPFNNFITSPTEVAVKWAQGSAAVASLCWEATMYEGLLDKLQGITVPVFYGLFLGDFGGTPMGCMVLEWCPSSGWEMAESPTRDEVRMRGLAVADLHKAQVHHGQLYAQGDALCWLDGRHFLRAQDGSVRVVDFSAAVHHECLGGNNSYWIDAEHLSEDCHCKELTLAMHHASRANAGLLKDVPWIPNPEKPQLEGDSRRISLSSLL
ncbi:uncharacterized protein BXZ73DRAFT_39314 [Epithele typhae]|uniref:uncharacterized protein n=1 Tax=Epithele typhae TaxID=378194 RepID=UPI0020081C98|nr:uncharacterized protein BXZ73DRAFT_39314 [Epithele typhae]KAH9944014.1 hypothetical protein BXZ73DRAFT_39314 [Epithele typhae]